MSTRSSSITVTTLLFLVLAPRACGGEASLPASCGQAGGLRAFRIQVPLAGLGEVDPFSIAARPAGGGAKVSLVHIDRASAIPWRLRQGVDRWEGEEELQRVNQEYYGTFTEKSRLQGEITALESLKKDSKGTPELLQGIEDQLRKKRAALHEVEEREKASSAKLDDLNKRKLEWFSTRRDQREANLEITGLYSTPGKAVFELAVPTSPPEKARALLTVACELSTTPAEDIEPLKAWARARAFDLGLEMITPGADAEFQRFTVHRLVRRFGLEPGGLPSSFRQGEGPGRFRPHADLYSVTTGALAIEESLQLGVELRLREGDGEVPLQGLTGPKIKSHPFKEMLRGRSPRLFPAAALVPEGNWYAHFSAIGAEIRLSDLLDQWGTSFLQTLEVSSRDRRLKEKLLDELAVDLSVLTRLFGDLVIGEMALTGSDPYLQDGSDVALVLQVKSRPIFEAHMARYREEAKRRRPDARETAATLQGVKVSSLATADRRVSSHSADLGDYRVYANSLAALKKVIDAHAGRIPRLSDAEDFKYLRTVFPGEPAAEDAFLYLSDRFIRNVVGPEQKIGRLRQMRCIASLRMIEFALLEWALEKGAASVPTLEALIAGGLLEEKEFLCLSGGKYQIAAGDGGPEVFCSVHNRLRLGTPLVEIPAGKASSGEAQGYREFVENYERYWSQYFDPVGIRFRISPEPAGTISAETCILPLIENSVYNGLREFFGGEAVRLEAGNGPRAIGSLSLKVPKELSVLERFFRETSGEDSFVTPRMLRAFLDQIGDGITLTLHDNDLLFTFSGEPLEEMLGRGGAFTGEGLMIGAILSAITLPVSISLDVKDPRAARALLDELFRRLVVAGHVAGAEDAWRSREFGFEVTSLDDYRGVPLGLVSLRFFFVNFQLHHAFLDRRLVVATQRWIITEAIDGLGKAPGEPKAGAPAAPEPSNLLLRVQPENFQRARVPLSVGWQSRMREACFANFPVEEVLLDGLALDPAGAAREGLRIFGHVPFCPAGGTYAIDARSGAISCSVHRTPSGPRQPREARGDEPFIRFLESLKTVEASFRFTPEGIRTRVTIERRGLNQ